MKTFTPSQLNELLLQKSPSDIVIDVRTPEEFAIEHIDGAVNMPLERFEDYKDKLAAYSTIVAYCNSGNSSAQFVKRVHQLGIESVYHLAGGLSGCKGQCKVIKQKLVLPMMQQVQVTAGALVLLGLLLSWTLGPAFIVISLFVGAGLVFAGLSGRCGMAKILSRMPWNHIPVLNQETTVDGADVHIKQFEDKNLAHYSYMLISDGKAVVVDPERDPRKYYEYAKQHNAIIEGVLNTHPHADFASGHVQIHNDTGAEIYVGDKVGAEYPHQALQDQDIIPVGNAYVTAYFTPGHSPDSMSYLVTDAHDKQRAFFTGDWVFIGDVGRADLRENVGNIKAKQAELAGMMYDSTRSILPVLDGDLMVLPAHGAGTSCGKGLSKQSMDTLANQLAYNPMLHEMSKEEFVRELTSDQPAIPAYFTNSVLLNKKGNSSYEDALKAIPHTDSLSVPEGVLIIDTRTAEQYINYPLVPNAINIPFDGSAFVSMFGAIVKPTQSVFLIIEKRSQAQQVLHGIVSIGYEDRLTGVYLLEENTMHHALIHQHDLTQNDAYMILDVRSETTFQDNPLFPNAINIPMEQLVDRVSSLERAKTYIPYCGGTYKSSIAYSVLKAQGFKTQKLAS